MTTAIDAIGGQDGTYQGTFCADDGLVAGTNLSADAQNNSTSYILLPDTAFPCVPAHDWSISGLVTISGSPIIAYFDWGPSNSEYIYLVVGSSPKVLILQSPTSVGVAQAIGATTLVNGTTYLLVGTFELSTNTFSVYVDGVLDGTVVNSDHGYASATTPSFAAFGSAGAVTASGPATFDEMAMYDVCLSAGDVSALQAARGSFSAFTAAVKGSGATNLYHLGEAVPCAGVVVDTGWHVGRIGVG